MKVKIDTENYRERRKETLENLARNLAHKVKRIHKSVVLEPMNPYERRVIHSTLQNDKYVETHSEGEEPYRKVVISLKPGFEKDYEKKKSMVMVINQDIETTVVIRNIIIHTERITTETIRMQRRFLLMKKK